MQNIKLVASLGIFLLLVSVPYISVYGVPSAYSPAQIVSDSFRVDRLLVKFRPGVAAQLARSNMQNDNLSITREYKIVDGLKLITIPPGKSLNDIMTRLLKNPNIEYVEPDYNVKLTNTNDADLSNLWALNNTGQNVNGVSGSADSDMNVFEAWSNTGINGDSSIVIAVIDSGVKYNHPDLVNNMWVNPGEIAANGVDDDGNGYIDDVYGINAITGSGDPMDDNFHGTHVAGTIAGVGNNSAGVTGVVQNAKIIACKFLSAGGSGATSDAIECLNYIHGLKQSGVNVVLTNNSWGGTGSSAALKEAIEQHMQDGILFVAAAGNASVNNDTSPHYPSSYVVPNLISVAATDQADAKASFSNYGRYSVHVGAPGVNIYSTTLADGYTFANGTSMATPNVSGVIALLKANDPSLDWKSLKNLIISSGTPLAALSTNTTSGRRVRAWDNDGTGAVTCSNQLVSAQLSPQQSSITKMAGATLGLSYLNINCASGAGASVVTTSGPEVVADLTLADSGLSYDTAANDGIYSAYWTAPATAGTYTLTFANSQTLTVNVLANTSTLLKYRYPVSIPYNPRALYFNYSAYPDGYWASVNASYYTFKFGSETNLYSAINADTKGKLFFAAPSAGMITGANTEMANDLFTEMVAPYWDDIDVSGAGNGIGFIWSYDPAATPVGEVGAAWKGVSKLNGNPVEVQAVFTAGSSDIEMHYTSTDNNADTATIGIQVDPVRATQQSYNSPQIASGTGWLWRVDLGAPTANAGTDQNVSGGDIVSLSGIGTDPDDGVVTYQWVQISGTVVSLQNANTQTANFTAPNTTEAMVFELTVTDDAGQTVTDQININVTTVSSPGVLSLSSPSYGIAENSGSVLITVTRTGGSVGAVDVNYASANDTAISDSDYVAVSGTLSWADGENASKTFSVNITNDAIYEGSEAFALNLTTPTGSAMLGTASSVVIITDDETPNYGQLSLVSSTYTANESATSITLSVSRSEGSDGIVSVDFYTSNGTAAFGSDYTSNTGTLTWADGASASKDIVISLSPDTIYEGDENLTLTLSNISGGASLGTNAATITIIEDDAVSYGQLQLSAAIYSVNENVASLNIPVTRTGGSDEAVSVDYTVSAGTASSGGDYTATASGTLNWAFGDSASKTITLTILDDSIYEGDETLSVGLSNVSGGASLGTSSAVATILDNETASYGTLALVSSSYSVNENAGSISLLVSRSGGSDGAVSVDYTTADTTALAASDYVTEAGSLNWSDGDSANKSITVSISDDVLLESSEEFSLTLSNILGGATLGTSAASVQIIDNEVPSPGQLSLSNSIYSVGEDGMTLSVMINRVGGSSGVVGVDYASADITASTGSDYQSVSGNLSWADAESTAKSIVITISDDAIYEGDENFALNLSNVSGGATLGISSASVTITENESANLAPDSPTLISIADGSTAVDGSNVSLEWNKVTDPDGDAVSYQLYYCTDAGFSGCSGTTVASISMDRLLGGLGGGMGLAMLGMIASGNRRQRLIQIGTMMLIVLVLSACEAEPAPPAGNPDNMSQTVTDLLPGTTYYWKVVASDGNGGSSESSVWQFTTN